MRKVLTQAHMPTEFTIEELGENKARICAWPFEIGFAITLAHPLRRLLHLGAVGYAATAVKIEGITHEFDSKRGMFEDISMFIINLKNMRFRIKDEESGCEEISFSFKGPKEIKGSDLANDKVEIITPDNYIATINEDADLEFSLIIEKGIGYVASEDLREKTQTGYIALDAYFNPVKNAVYEIENVLFQDNPDYEKIVFDITTDGQISPVEAFKNALNAMHQQLGVFAKISTATPILTSGENMPGNNFAKLLKSISELELSNRNMNALTKVGIEYIGQLAIMSREEISKVQSLGKKSVDEIVAAMDAIGYSVGDPKVLVYKDKLLAKINELKENK